MKHYSRLSIIFLLGCFASVAFSQQAPTATIDTTEPLALNFSAGSKKGTYYAMADSLNSLGNLKVSVSASQGTIENVQRVKNGKADIAFAQLDILVEFTLKSEGSKKVKILLPVYNEALHIVASKKIGKVRDLRRKSISVGTGTSGSSTTAYLVMPASGLDVTSLDVDRSNTEDGLALLRKGKLSALFAVGGAPIKALKNISGADAKKLHMLSVSGTTFNSLRREGLPYGKGTLSAKQYPWMKSSVATLTVPSALIVRADMPDAQVKIILDAVFNQQKALQAKQAKWGELSAARARDLLNDTKSTFIQLRLAI